MTQEKGSLLCLRLLCALGVSLLSDPVVVFPLVRIATSVETSLQGPGELVGRAVC